MGKEKAGYTHEQWSRILSAHAGGQLKRSGWPWPWPTEPFDWTWLGTGCCVNQAAFLDGSRFDAKYEHGDWARERACAFDSWYRPDMTVEDLLKLLS